MKSRNLALTGLTLALLTGCGGSDPSNSAQEQGIRRSIAGFQITVSTLQGSRTPFRVARNTSVVELRQMVFDQVSLFADSPDSIRLIFNGTRLEAGRTLGDYDIQQDSNILAVAELRAD